MASHPTLIHFIALACLDFKLGSKKAVFFTKIAIRATQNMFKLLPSSNLIDINPLPVIKQRLPTTRINNKIELALRNVWKYIYGVIKDDAVQPTSQTNFFNTPMNITEIV